MRSILSLIVFLPIYITSAQTLGKILAIKDSSAVEGANIRLVNSDQGWSSGSNGIFFIKNVSTDDYFLITHVSFEDRMIQAVDLNSPIFLKEKEIPLNTVEIEAGVDKEWQKNFRIFQEEIFGYSPLAYSVHIQNPWVIDFERKSGALMATASEPIKIKNESTGYNLTLVLEHFRNSGKLSSYQGKPFFEEISGNNGALREAIFKGSIRHFLFSVIHDITFEQGFQIYKCKFDRASNSFVTNKSIKSEDIISIAEDSIEIFFDDYIKVIYTKEELPKRNAFNYSPRHKVQVSYLKCEKPIKLDLLGNSLNSGLQDFGYWANVERVAHWLPLNYLTDDLKQHVSEYTTNTKTED